MRNKNKSPKETLNRYSTLVRQAMSDGYVECVMRKNRLRKKELEITRRLEGEKDTLPYNKYVELQNELKEVEQKYHDQTVMLDIWDQAREICMECADEVFGGEFDRFIDIWNSLPEEYPVSKKELERLVATGR